METVSVDLMQDPGVKGAFDRLQGFRGDLADVEHRMTETNSRLSGLRNKEHSGPIDKAAKALVAGKPFKDVEGDIAILQGEYPKLSKRRAVVARAAELQRKKLDQEEDRASREICERVEPEYREIIARLARIMIDLGKAKMADLAFFDALRDGGVKYGSLRRMNLLALGDPNDRNSSFAQWFMEAIAFGLVDEATVPAEWIERWNK